MPPDASPSEAGKDAKVLPKGLVTFLFTDLEDSTRLWDEHPDVMPAALARHDELLRAAVERHGGAVVKTTGDGLLAVLTSSSDAVAAAADALRRLATEEWGGTGALRVRIGIHTADAEPRDGDYHGPAVNRGARLMAAAHGGQIVLSRASADEVRDALPRDLGLLDLGDHRLRGLSGPERVYQLTVAELPSQFPPLQTLDAFPGSLRRKEPSFARLDDGLAGRDAEVDRLERAWQQAGDGAVQVALVAGEPGIGKTRLAAEIARRAHEQGGVVLYGRCDQETIVPYQPFVEALRPLVATISPAAMHERLHGLEQDLARLFPEFLGRIPGEVRPISGDPETERYRLFEAMTTMITGVAVGQPALLVLDDVHWADRPTLQLLRHLVRAARRAALLVVICYRDVELARDAPLADLLADLRRESFATWVALHGLSVAESAALLQGIAGHVLEAPLVEALHRETGGNPLFLEELLRHLIETGALASTGGETRAIDVGALDLPAGVREVVVRRLARLSPVVNDVLSAAAVVGSDFDAMLLGRAIERATEEVLNALDEAGAAGLVAEDAGGAGRYTFSHALIRQTLYGELGVARRAQLHARVGEALEATRGLPVGAAVLAQHFTRALPLVDVGKAIEYTTKAGHDAAADLVFDDAVAFFERALELLEQHAPTDAIRRVDLLIDRAEALVSVDERAGIEAALEAVHEARAMASPERLGRVVVVFAEPGYGAMAYPSEVTELLREAVAALGDGHPALRARLIAIQAFKSASYQLPVGAGWELTGEALRLARTADDSFTLANALHARATSLEGSPDVADRIALGEELVELGRSLGAAPTTFGLRVLARAHIEAGDAIALSATIAELGRVGTELRWLPARLFHAQWSATVALLEGRFDEVGTYAEAMRGYERAYQAAAGMLAVQSFFLARERGEVRDAHGLAGVAEQHVHTIYPRALFAASLHASGDADGARAVLERLGAAGFHRDARESGWAGGLALLAEIASDCDPGSARELYELLSPYAGRLAVALGGLACLGAADRYLGMLAAARRQWDVATAHFDNALVLEERIGGRALLPRTQYWRARALRARGAPDDVRDARAILEAVVDESARLGMRQLGEQASALANE
ncbi:MAG: AAA family ATPase [Acidimicrobiia bacterium]